MLMIIIAFISLYNVIILISHIKSSLFYELHENVILAQSQDGQDIDVFKVSSSHYLIL